MTASRHTLSVGNDACSKGHGTEAAGLGFQKQKLPAKRAKTLERGPQAVR